MVLGTKEKIVTAFIELAASQPQKTSFSIAEVAAQAGISRQSIYRNHFNSTEEIIETIHQQFTRDMFSSMANYNPEMDGSILSFLKSQVIPVIYQEREWLGILFSTAADPTWNSFITDLFLDWFCQHVEIQTEAIQLEKEILARFVVEGIISVFRVWLTNHPVLPPDTFAQGFVTLMDAPISDFLQARPADLS